MQPHTARKELAADRISPWEIIAPLYTTRVNSTR